jgi:hypothetical protein
MSLPPRLDSEAARPTPAARPDPLRALHHAAATSKTPFSTLVSIAMAESSFDANAKSKTSSATGPFQITERTWLQLVKRYGAEAGRPDLAALVGEDAAGRATIDPAHKTHVLEARKDVDLSAKLAAKLCDESRSALTRKLGRTATETEVRMAYFLGVPGATRLLAAATDTPETSVKSLLPRAYASNRAMLSASGSPLTASEAADSLHSRYTRELGQTSAARSYASAGALAGRHLAKAVTEKPAEPIPAPVAVAADVLLTPADPAPVTATEAPAKEQVQVATASEPKELECRPDEKGGVICRL